MTTILHLGPLGVGPGFNTEEFVKQVKGSLDEYNCGLADYVAICGNLTRGGRPDEFAQLEELLKHLVAAVVRGAGDYASKLDRLMVVPGPADEQGEFAAFCERVLCMPLEPDGTVVRHLKDLSLIGVRYWNNGPRVNRALLHEAKASLDRVLHQPEFKEDYIRNTPTLLLSADSPFCAEQAPDLKMTQELRAMARPGFDVTAHLIGGNSCRLWRQAFTEHRHFTVAAGPASSDEGVFPLTINTITIGDVVRADNGVRRSLRVCAIRRDSPDDSRPDELLDGHVTGPAHDARGQELVLEVFKHQLETALSSVHDTCAVITGFPGSGKTSLAMYLLNTTSFNGTNVQGYFTRLRRWDKESVEKLFKSLVARAAHSSDALSHPMPLIVIEAGALPRTEAADDGVVKLFAIIAEFFSQLNDKAYVALFVPEVPERNAHEFTILRLSRVDDDRVYAQFLASHSAVVPLHGKEIDILTGRWIGFTNLLVERARHTFTDRYLGSTPVNARTATELIEAALGSVEARQQANRFRDHFSQGGAYEPVLDHLGSELVQARTKGKSEVRFSQSSVIQALQGQRASGIKRALEKLASEGILRQGAPADYVVAVPFPFLAAEPVRRIRRSISVFISHDTKSNAANAKAIVDGLNARKTSDVELKIYYQPEVGPDPTEEWRAKLHRNLLACPNLIFLHNGAESFASKHVGGEVVDWLRQWRSKRSSRTTGPTAAFFVSFGGDTFPQVYEEDVNEFPEDYISKVDRYFSPHWNGVDDRFLDHVYRALVEDPPDPTPRAAES